MSEVGDEVSRVIKIQIQVKPGLESQFCYFISWVRCFSVQLARMYTARGSK